MRRAFMLACAIGLAGCSSANPTARYADESGYVERWAELRHGLAKIRSGAAITSSPVAAEARLGRMVRISAGSFMMGSKDGYADERPVHKVDVAAFEMDETEVTVAAYKACVDAGKCTAPNTDGLCNWGKPDRDRHPVNCVDWEQSKAFCEWAGKRLPSEEEWEYAARGKEGRNNPWGNDELGGQLCWKRSEGTCVVGSHPSGDTPTGLKDMAGNVWEWTSSGYSEDYNKNRAISIRVARGGSWGYGYALVLRSSHRSGYEPPARNADLGLRCAR
jgi:formylglycine-generating enzyme required for sulfatase activity